MNGWVKSNFEDNNWKYISKEEYEKTVSQLAEVYDELPVQLIHRNVHLGNFLFSEGKEEYEKTISYVESAISYRFFCCKGFY